MYAGFDGIVADGTSYLTAAADDNDSIDLLFLHIAWDKATRGSSCNPANALQLDAGTPPLQHTQHASALPADIAPAVGLNEGQCAGSNAALHQWLDEVIRLLFQYPTFSSCVLTAILLKDHKADSMLQVCVLAAHMLALRLAAVHAPVHWSNAALHCMSAQLQPVIIK